MRIPLLFILSLVSSAIFCSDKIVDGEYHVVTAKKGDGIDVLLQRYELLGNQSMAVAFRKLNQLSPQEYLYSGKTYKLPVTLYNYNGKSIRSTIGNSDWDTAVAIKEYNEKLLKKGVRSTHYTVSKILWVPLHLKIGSLTIPQKNKSLAGRKTLNIYGKGNAIKKQIDHQFKNKVVYVVAGHGGPDPGATCEDCSSLLCEDEYAYDVALRLARNLEEHGAIVEMVIQDKNDGIRNGKILKCDKDERLANGKKLPGKQLTRLQQRTNYINKKTSIYRKQGIKDQVVVSIHVDSNSKSTKQDVFFCYAKGSAVSKELARTMSKTFAKKYKQHQRNRTYSGHLHARQIYVLRNTAPPAVLIELANIRNKHDHKRILQEGNRQALANWIFDGLVDHFRLTPSVEKVLASN